MLWMSRNLPKPISSLFDQIWNDDEKLKGRGRRSALRHIDTVYQEKPAERVYFMILFKSVQRFPERDLMRMSCEGSNGILDSLVLEKLFNYSTRRRRRIINKLETFITLYLADSVGL